MQLDSIATMDRRSLIAVIISEDWGFPVDFTPEYLACLTEDKLRHIVAALHQQSQAMIPARSAG